MVANGAVGTASQAQEEMTQPAGVFLVDDRAWMHPVGDFMPERHCRCQALDCLLGSAVLPALGEMNIGQH